MIDLDSAILYSKDIPRVIDFYKNNLGFELEYNEDDYSVSFIFPSGKKLGIRQEKGEREKAGHQTVFFSVDNIEEYYKKLQSGDFNIYRELEEHPWGKAFAIMDPDNNKIEFIQR
jgi:predicted enzyme related to lactoylglutathione lyase